MERLVPAAQSDQRQGPASDGVTGHAPVHPRWTHAPMGGLVFVAVFDLVSGVAGSTRPWARDLYRAGTFVLSASLPLVAVAIGTGLIDRAGATTARTAVRARVNLHAAVMVAMAAALAADLALRRFVYPDARRTPGAVLAVTLVALAAAMVAGDVGGRLTYRAGVGVQPQNRVGRSDHGRRG